MTPRLSGFAVSSSSTDTMLVERLGAYESSNGPASSDREASIEIRRGPWGTWSGCGYVCQVFRGLFQAPADGGQRSSTTVTWQLHIRYD